MATQNGETLRRQQIQFSSDRVFRWKEAATPKDLLEKVKTRLQGLPIEVRTYGFSVALATLLREGRPESRAIADGLAEWLLDKSPLKCLDTSGSGTSGTRKPLELLRLVVAADRGTYAAVQTDAMGLCEQLKLLSAVVFSASKAMNGGSEKVS